MQLLIVFSQEVYNSNVNTQLQNEVLLADVHGVLTRKETHVNFLYSSSEFTNSIMDIAALVFNHSQVEVLAATVKLWNEDFFEVAIEWYRFRIFDNDYGAEALQEISFGVFAAL